MPRFFSRSPGPSPRPRVILDDPPATIYAIGDVHGCLDLLVDLERTIVADSEPREGSKLIVMLGDYVDRGPASAQVLDHLMQPPPPGFERICLAGNHEVAMLEFLREPSPRSTWLRIGGSETLQSYGIPLPMIEDGDRRALRGLVQSHVPDEHLAWLAELPILVATDRYIFVHAGVVPGVPHEKQQDRDLLGFGDGTSGTYASAERTVVHGHIALKAPLLTERRISVDTGAYMTGTLSALRLFDGTPSIMQVSHNSHASGRL